MALHHSHASPVLVTPITNARTAFLLHKRSKIKVPMIVLCQAIVRRGNNPFIHVKKPCRNNCAEDSSE